MIFSLQELIDVIVMTAAVGFIFMDLFRRTHKTTKQAFLFSCLVTAPALIFHELAHKFIAISYGLTATYHAAYWFLLIGVGLKLLKSGFIFFVPAYVSIAGAEIAPGAGALIAFAGPFLNLVLFLAAWAMLKQKKLKTSTYMFLHVTKQINLFLFVFNMLPIPLFDGFKVYSGLYHLVF